MNDRQAAAPVGRALPVATVAILSVIVGIAPVAAQERPVVPMRVPPVPTYQEPERQLARDARNAIDLIARDPTFATDTLPKTTPVWIVVDGEGRNLLFKGDAARAMLHRLFRRPADGVVFVFSDPEATINGDFGRVVMTYTVREKGRTARRCRAIYVDALHDPNGWQIIQMVLAPAGHLGAPACPEGD